MRNTFFKILFLAGIAFSLSSCIKDMEMREHNTPAKGGMHRIRINLHDSARDAKSSYAADEDAIKNYCLFLFDEEGQTIYSEYLDGSDIAEVMLPEGSTIFAYAFANVGDILDCIASASDVPSFRMELSNAMLNEAFPMYGEDIIITDDTEGEFTIYLNRIVAKYTLRVDKSGISNGTLLVKGVTLKNIAASVAMSSYSKARSLDDIIAEGDHSSQSDVAALNAGGSAVFYVPENRQGRESGITSSRMKVPSYEFRTVNPNLCTYLEVACVYSGYSGTVSNVTYRMYLGANATDDFNVTRNTAYSITLQPDEDHIFDSSWKCDGETMASVILRSKATGEVIDPRNVTVAENCYFVIEAKSTGSPLIRNTYKTISSISCDEGYSFNKDKITITTKLTVDCVYPLLNKAGKVTYHITTSDGLQLDYAITSNKPQLRLTEPTSYMLLGGSDLRLETRWYNSRDVSIDPDVFFNSEAAQKAFRDVTFIKSSNSASRTILTDNGMDVATVSIDESTRNSLVGNLWAGFSDEGTYDISVALNDNNNLDSKLNECGTGFCYFTPSILIDHPNINIPYSVDVKIPWVNTPARNLGTVNDYSIVPYNLLKSGLSYTGSLGKVLPFPLTSQTLTLDGTLSRNPYTHYVSGATFKIQAVSTILNYSFTGARHPAGRIALVASIENKRNPDCVPLTLNIGRVDCYTYIPVGTYTGVRNIGYPFYDEETQERLYPVSVGVGAFFPYKSSTTQDYPIYYLQNAMKYNGSANRMIRGRSDTSGERTTHTSSYGTETYSLQDISYPVVDWWPGEDGAAALRLTYRYIYNGKEYSGGIGHISEYVNCTQDQGFALDAYMSELWGHYFNLYDYIKSGTYGSTSTQTAHYPCQGDTKYVDDNGLGYYIVTPLEYLTPYRTLEQLNYQAR